MTASSREERTPKPARILKSKFAVGASANQVHSYDMIARSWRGGRVAEGAPLLRAYGLTLIEGSNPSLSAIQSCLC